MSEKRKKHRRSSLHRAHPSHTKGGLQTLLRGTGDTGTLTSAPGYDDWTGLGSPNGLSFLSGLAPHSRLVTSARRQTRKGGRSAKR